MHRQHAISYERADELKAELSGHDADQQLLDGLTAADSLARVLAAEKRFEQVIVFSGADYRARLEDEANQDVLF